MQEPVNMKFIRSLLGATSNQVYMWHQRRARNGFPEAIASTHIPQHPGDKRKAPLFDLEAVLDWWTDYDPLSRHGKHFEAKRGEGVPPRHRGKKTQATWHARRMTQD